MYYGSEAVAHTLESGHRTLDWQLSGGVDTPVVSGHQDWSAAVCHPHMTSDHPTNLFECDN